MRDYRNKKIKYSMIDFSVDDCRWCYDYKELQYELNKVCKNHTLKKVYVSLYNFLDSSYFDDNYRNFDICAFSVVLFDNIAVLLSVHGEGMIRFRIFNISEVKIRETVDYPPDDMFTVNDNYYYDMSKEFKLSFEDVKVTEVVVDNIDYYPFVLSGYDRQKADQSVENNCLPNAVHFKLENGVDLGICADDIEYFYIKLKK